MKGKKPEIGTKGDKKVFADDISVATVDTTRTGIGKTLKKIGSYTKTKLIEIGNELGLSLDMAMTKQELYDKILDNYDN